MKVAGLITEYNPFHNGHLYHIEESRKITAADYIIVVMSGDFVQRGAPAMIDKYHRTRMALLCGADLVLELPVIYATASAEHFAYGAVKTLHSTGVVDAISFGSEEGDVKKLTQIADLLTQNPKEYSLLLKKYLKEGQTFPQARALALSEGAAPPLREPIRRILSAPNNILGIEYVKALKKLQSPMLPVTIPRIMTGYHDLSLTAAISSATGIRNYLENGNDITGIREALPAFAYETLKTAPALTADDFSALLSYRLLTLPEEELTAFLDVSAPMANRMKEMKTDYLSITDFTAKLKSRQYTHTRISRALFHILLDIRNEDLLSCSLEPAMPYLRVLGFKRSAAALLGEINKKGASPLLTKAAREDHPLHRKDLKAAHIYNSVLSFKYQIPMENEYQKGPVIL